MHSGRVSKWAQVGTSGHKWVRQVGTAPEHQFFSLWLHERYSCASDIKRKLSLGACQLAPPIAKQMKTQRVIQCQRWCSLHTHLQVGMARTHLRHLM